MHKVFLRFLLMLLPLTTIVDATGQDRAYCENKKLSDKFFSFLGIDAKDKGYNKSYALVIGISEYKDSSAYADLPTKNDHQDMAEYLCNQGGFDDVYFLTEDKVTVARVRQLMEDYFPKKLGEDDRFLFYWAGHGVDEKLYSGSYFGHLPVQSSQDKKYNTMVDMDDIKSWDKRINAKQTLYLLDSCFSGLVGVVHQGSKAKTLTLEQLAHPSRQILSAGTGQQTTFATAELGGSIFTRAILDGLLTGKADSNTYKQDGIISISELELHIREYVKYKKDYIGWKFTIKPQLSNLDMNQGEFYFFSTNKKVKKEISVAKKVQEVTPIIVPQSSQPTNNKWNPKIYRGERSYIKNSTNTVKDNHTGLIWQKADDGVQRTWSDAKKYCQDLTLDGYSDWRLPSVEELYYLGDITKYNPALDTNYFGVKSSWYWSNTTYKNNSSYAWLVNFFNGDDNCFEQSYTGYVLCVRGQ